MDKTVANQTVSELAELIESTVGLEANQAKAIVFFAIATFALTQLEKFPIMAIYGPAGTGKTTILNILKQICRGPVQIDGKVTKAVLRDSLKSRTTALIDEADRIHEPWLVNRYSKQSSTTSVNKEGEQGWAKVEQDLFGATALHRRIPFKDPAILSRSIVVTTRPRTVLTPFREDGFSPFAAKLKELAMEVNWQGVKERTGNRIIDTWAPLLEVAGCLVDEEWVAYAEGEMEGATTNLNRGQEEEPSQAVYRELLALTVSPKRVLERVLIKEIVDGLCSAERMNSWQVGQLLRDMGFVTKTVGGNQYVYTGGKEKLMEVGKALAVEDEWLEGDEEAVVEGPRVLVMPPR